MQSFTVIVCTVDAKAHEIAGVAAFRHALRNGCHLMDVINCPMAIYKDHPRDGLTTTVLLSKNGEQIATEMKVTVAIPNGTEATATEIAEYFGLGKIIEQHEIERVTYFTTSAVGNLQLLKTL